MPSKKTARAERPRVVNHRFSFDVGDRVLITRISRVGKVIELCVDIDRAKFYKVSWEDNGVTASRDFRAEEIERV